MHLVRWLMASPLKGASKLYLGGDNTWGQLGDNTILARSSPVLVSSNYWKSFALGTSHAVAVRNDGALFGWGNNDNGQVGDGFVYNNILSPTRIGTSSWTSVAASDVNSYAIRTDGGLFAWGDNSLGQVGNNTTVTTANYSWTQVSSSEKEVFIRSDGKVFTNDIFLVKNAGLRLGTYNPILNIASLDNANNYTYVYYGSRGFLYDSVNPPLYNYNTGNYFAGIKTDGALVMRGRNLFGELGNNSTNASFSITQIGTSSWTQICVQNGSSVAIRSDGALFTWGSNKNGQLGQNLYPGNDNRSSPVQVGTSSWTQVAVNSLGATMAAIRLDGALFMWGAPAVQSVYGGLIPNNGAAQLTNISFTMLGAETCLDSNGNGYFVYQTNTINAEGSLAFNSQINNNYDALQKFAGSWSKVERGYALKSDGSLYNWGLENTGIPVIAGYTNNSPTQVGSSSWSFISVAPYSYAGVTAPAVAAIRSDGALFMWGHGGNGALGNNTTIYQVSPVQIGTSSWTQIDSNGSHTLAIRTDGALFAWGVNSSGQLGDGTTVNKSSPVQIGTSSWTQVGTTLAGSASYAIRSDGALFAWGNGLNGRLGDNTTISKSSPVQIGTSSWTQIGKTCAGQPGIAIRSDGALFMWGDNNSGFLGDGTTINRSSPVQIGTSSWTQVRTNTISSVLTNYYTIGIGTNGAMFVWGPLNFFAEIVSGNYSSPVQIGVNSKRIFSPVQIGTSSWAQVSLGQRVGMAIRSDGALFGWGSPQSDSAGAIGDGTTINRSSPVQIGTSSWSQVSCGWYHTLAIRLDKALFAWGANNSLGFQPLGNIGDGTTINRSSPVQIGTSSWSVIGAGSARSYAVRSDGALFGWGVTASGQAGLGDNTTIARSSPVLIGTSFTFVSSPVQIGTSSWSLVTAGKSYASAIRSDRALFAWGVNTNYNLGDGTSLNRSSPVQIGTSSWTLVNAGTSFTVGIASNSALYGWGNNDNFAVGVPDFVNPIMGAGFSHGAIVSRKGRLYTWGLNNFGQLGDGTTVNKSSPIQIGTSSWSIVSGGFEHTLALNSIGQLYAWGRNDLGQLGDNTSINKSSPVQIGTSSWAQIKAGISHSMAVRIDGALFTWGSNSFGQLGRSLDTLPLNVSSPVQVGTSSWTFATTNRETAYAIRSDGALFGWGKNDVGQIGNNAVNISGVMSWTQVTTGGAGQSGRGIRSDGGLFAWGTNGSGQLGDGTITDRLSPVQIGTSSWTQIAGLLNSTAAIRFDGALFTWGNGSFGQLGSNATTNRSSPVQVGTSSWTQIKAGNNNYTALRSDGGLFTFGVNSAGQLGDGTTTDRSSPVQIGTSSWTAIGAGSFHTLAIRNDGALYAWGQNIGGQLGDGTYPYENRSSPVQIGTSSWTQVTGGNYHTVALRNDSGLFAWGWNEFGQLGTNSILYGSERVFSWTQISAKQDVSAAIRSDGKLFTWGLGSNGGLGTNSTVNNTYSPVQVGNSSWTQVAAGALSCAAIRTDGALFTWGWNNYGQLGNNTVVNTSSPVQIGTSSWIQVTSGLRAKFAIRTDGALYGWGGSDVTYTFGAEPLGDGTTISRSSPVLIGGTSSWTQVNAGWYTYSAIRTDGALFMWGNSNQGGTGKGDPFGSDIYSWTQVSSSGNHTLALNSLGQIWAWGNNTQGQIGINNIINQSSPVQIGTSSWTLVSAGGGTSAAIRSDGRLFVWGYNGGVGAVGDGTTLNRSSPVQVGTSSWTQVATGGNGAQGGGFQFTAAIRSDGGLFTWGNNSNGQLGSGTIVSRSSPVQVGTSSWTQVNIGTNGVSTYAIRTDGGLFVWGNNSYGQLGDDTTVSKSSPVQVGTSSWTQINAGYDNVAAAIRSDGALFAWGANNVGQTATGDFDYKSSPVQIGTSSWTQVKLGIGSFAIRSDGRLFAWGQFQTENRNTTNLLGTGTTSYIDYRQSWSQLDAGNGIAAAIKTDGSLYIWGTNGALNSIVPTSPFSLYPTFKIGTSSWSLISTGFGSIAAIRTDGALFLWGDNQFGKVGDGTTINRSSPVQLGTSSWIQVKIGARAQAGTTDTVVALRSDGALFAWGQNQFGQIGDGTTINKSSPVQIGTSSWMQVTTDYGSTIAIRTDGALFTWGTGLAGALADGTTVNKSSPVQIGTSSWTLAAVGGRAIRSDGALFAWGPNEIGQVGDNTTINRSSPVQIGTSSWTFVNSSQPITGIIINQAFFYAGLSVHAIRKDGALFGWGDGAGGVGDGTTVNRSSPVQIGTNSWTFVRGRNASSAGHAAIRSDGLVYYWGSGFVAATGFYQWSGLNLESPTGPSSYVPYNDGNVPYSPTPVEFYQFYNSPVQVGTDSWIQVASNGYRNGAFGIRNNNKMYAWGENNTDNSLGDGTTLPRSSPVQIGFYSTLLSPQRIGTASWTQINLGYFTGAGITTNGRLHTWGQNASGQIGDSTTLNQFTIQERGVYSWTQIATGGRSAFSYDFTGVTFAAIRSDGGLFTWGDNTYGQLGNNTGGFGTSRSSPVQVGTSSWVQVSIGPSNVLAIRYGDYAVYGWGAGGGVGDNTAVNRSSPVAIGTLRAEKVYSGNAAFIIEKWTNTLRGWGYNAFGQVGDGTTVTRSSPVLIGASRWREITGNYFQTIAIREDGGLFTWGSPEYGQLADNSTAYRSSPVQVGTSSWTQVKGSPWAHALAIRNDGALFTWGSYSFGQGGRNEDFFNGGAQNISKSWSVVCVNDGSISAGIQTDGSLYLWGISYSGESLNLTPSIGITIISPAQVGTSSWSQVATGNAQGVLAIRTDGALFAWGGNPAGGVGDNTTISKSSPVQIGTSSWTQVTYGYNTAYAIRSDGALFSWGSGSSGALGSNATTSRSSPVQIGTSSWSQIKASAGDFVLAIRKDGALFAWGSNYIGQVGDSTTVNRSSPVQIGNSSWSQIGVDAAASFAIRTDGSLFSWGSNGSGQLGDNTTVNKSSPVQIGTSSWIQVGPSIAIRTDGALFTWGAAVGVGLNDNINRSSPVQLGTSSWSIVPSISTASYNLRAALRSDRALFTWGGYDSKGQGTPDIVQYAYNIGLNGTSDTGSSSPVQVGLVATYNSPVQIGTSSWSQIAATAYTSSAVRSDGALFTWGRNNFGQLGDNTTVNKSSPIQIGSGSWAQVNGNQSSFYGLAKDNTVYVWGCGGNSSPTGGALGDGTTTNKSSPVQLGYTGSWTNVAMDISIGGATRSDGALFMWGNNSSGNFGNNSTVSASSPVQIGTDSWTIVQVSDNTSKNSYFLRSNNLLYGTGVGVPDSTNPLSTSVFRSSPVLIGLVRSVSSPVQIGTSSWSQVGTIINNTSVAIRTGGSLFTWGFNSSGELADGTTINKSSPVQIGSSSWIFASGNAGILSNNTLYTWSGPNSLGDNSANPRSSPVQLGSYPLAKSPIQIGTSSWTTISAGGTHAVAIRSNGSLFGWGLATSGQVGDGTLVSKSSPVQIGSSSWTAITAGNLTSYGITSAKLLFAWGGGANGTFGDGTTTNKPSPVQISAAAWNDVSSDDTTAYATRSDGKLFAWGVNANGQIGTLTTANTSSPVQVGTFFGSPTVVDSGSWNFVSAGFDNSIGIDSNKKAYIWGNDRTSVYTWTYLAYGAAIRSDGALFRWGRNVDGEIGDGTTVSKLSPVQIGTSSWTQVRPSYQAGNTLAIRSDGALFAWGNGLNGRLGDNTAISKSSPVQIGTSSWVTLPSINGGQAMFAIRLDGRLFGWGVNSFPGGSIGDNTIIDRSSPVQIGTSSWTQVISSLWSTWAIRSDGALFGWGTNSGGQLGDNTIINRSSPVQIGTSSWTMIASVLGTGNTSNAWAIRSDGALFSWGTDGSLNGRGLGFDYTNKSSPVQIGTSSWIQVAGDPSGAIAIRSDGALFRWGFVGSDVTSPGILYNTPVQVASLSSQSWTQINIGIYIYSSGSPVPIYGLTRNDNKKFLYYAGSGPNGPVGPSLGSTDEYNYIGERPILFADIISYSSPTQIGAGGTWIKGSTGAGQNYLINNANVLYSWGSRILSAGVIENNNNITAEVADIDSAVANKAFNVTRGYIEK